MRMHMEVVCSIEYLLPQVGQKWLWQRKGTNFKCSLHNDGKSTWHHQKKDPRSGLSYQYFLQDIHKTIMNENVTKSPLMIEGQGS